MTTIKEINETIPANAEMGFAAATTRTLFAVWCDGELIDNCETRAEAEELAKEFGGCTAAELTLPTYNH